MIIDSHAHYTHNRFANGFRYLALEEDGYVLVEGDRENLYAEMRQAGILWTIEPGVSLESNEKVLTFCREHPGSVFPAVGVHPTRCIHEKWRDRKKLVTYATADGVIAIGETGLDFHHPRKEQHRFRQMAWFIYQLNLAWKFKLPVILHVRDAHEDALRILRWHPANKFGGVIHCFYGDKLLALQYLKLGYHIGIGGSLLQKAEWAEDLEEAVREIPMERILLETDAPYIAPHCENLRSKLVRRSWCEEAVILR